VIERFDSAREGIEFVMPGQLFWAAQWNIGHLIFFPGSTVR
jgi:hypothetical protein